MVANMKMKTLLTLSTCLLMVGCSTTEKQKVEEVKSNQTKVEKKTEKKSEEKTETKKQEKKEEVKVEVDEPQVDYNSIDELVNKRFESKSINDDDAIRQSIVESLTNFQNDVLNGSPEDDVSVKYFMSSRKHVKKLMTRVISGYRINESSLVMHNTRSEGVIEWAIKLNFDGEERVLSGFRNQMGHMPLTYLE